jgi:hypothetical protein
VGEPLYRQESVEQFLPPHSNRNPQFKHHWLDPSTARVRFAQDIKKEGRPLREQPSALLRTLCNRILTLRPGMLRVRQLLINNRDRIFHRFDHLPNVERFAQKPVETRSQKPLGFFVGHFAADGYHLGQLQIRV